jgi:hypothetical protein
MSLNIYLGLHKCKKVIYMMDRINVKSKKIIYTIVMFLHLSSFTQNVYVYSHLYSYNNAGLN